MFFAYNPVTATGLYLNTIFVRINVRTRSFDQRTGGGQRLQPVFCIVSQASMALCRSIRRRVIGSGGRGGT